MIINLYQTVHLEDPHATRLALVMAIDTLRDRRRRWAVSASMDRYGFDEGKRARLNYDRISRAIEALQDFVLELNPLTASSNREAIPRDIG